MEQFAQGHAALPTSGYQTAEAIPRKETVELLNLHLLNSECMYDSELIPFDPHVGCTVNLLLAEITWLY